MYHVFLCFQRSVFLFIDLQLSFPLFSFFEDVESFLLSSRLLSFDLSQRPLSFLPFSYDLLSLWFVFCLPLSFLSFSQSYFALKLFLLSSFLIHQLLEEALLFLFLLIGYSLRFQILLQQTCYFRCSVLVQQFQAFITQTNELFFVEAFQVEFDPVEDYSKDQLKLFFDAVNVAILLVYFAGFVPVQAIEQGFKTMMVDGLMFHM